jgi:hypothetical protein
MTDITIRNQSPYTTPNGGASGTDGTTAPKKTENTTGNGVTGNDGTVPDPKTEGKGGGQTTGINDGADEAQITDADVLAAFGIDEATWNNLTPRDKEVLMKAMIAQVNQMSKQATDDITLNAAAAQTANNAQAGELDAAAKKVMTGGILQLVAGAGFGVLGAGMQGFSAFKMVKSSSGETMKLFNNSLKEMNGAANAAGKEMGDNIKKMSAEMQNMSQKAAAGTLKATDIDNFKATYGDQLKNVIGPDKYKAFTDKLDNAVARGLDGNIPREIVKEAFQDAQRQTTSNTSKAIKGAKAEARKEFAATNDGMKTATALMDQMMAPLKKYEFMGAIAGAGEKSLNSGSTITQSQSQSDQADAAREQAKAQQTTAQKDVVTEQKRSMDKFLEQVIAFLDKQGQIEADQMGAVTRGK